MAAKQQRGARRKPLLQQQKKHREAEAQRDEQVIGQVDAHHHRHIRLMPKQFA